MRIRKKRLRWGLALVLAIGLGCFLYQWFLADHSIVVSKETTHWTEPLDDNGLPDLRAILLESRRAGATPDNNGAVQFWQAIWPGDLGPVYGKSHAAVQAELGVAMPTLPRLIAPGGMSPEPWAAWLLARRGFPDLVEPMKTGDPDAGKNEHVAAACKDAQDLVSRRLDDLAIGQPWSAESIAPLAQWARDNKRQLDLLVEGSRKPKFYDPLPTLITEPDGLLIETLLPGVNKFRTAVRSLVARAMMHVGAGDYDAAWTDLDAAAGLAGHLDQEYQFIVEELVYLKCQQIADNGLFQLLSRPDLPRPLAEAVLARLAARPKIKTVARSLDKAERLMSVDLVLRMARGEASLVDAIRMMQNHTGSAGAIGKGGGGLVAAAQRRLFNWNRVLIQVNRWYDRLSEAAAEPDWEARQTKVQALAAQLAQLSPTRSEALRAALSRGARSDLVGDVFAAILLPSWSYATQCEDRTNTQADFLRLAAALAVYRAEHGEYPESLAELTPAPLDVLPVDLFHHKPYHYRRTDEGYVLYSSGPNAIDEQGSNESTGVLQGSVLTLETDAARAGSDDAAAGADTDAAMDAFFELKSRIPKGADDIPLRMPPVTEPWPIERSDEPAPTGE